MYALYDVKEQLTYIQNFIDIFNVWIIKYI